MQASHIQFALEVDAALPPRSAPAVQAAGAAFEMMRESWRRQRHPAAGGLEAQRTVRLRSSTRAQQTSLFCCASPSLLSLSLLSPSLL